MDELKLLTGQNQLDESANKMLVKIERFTDSDLTFAL